MRTISFDFRAGVVRRSRGMRRFAVAAVLVLAALLIAASTAYSQPKRVKTSCGWPISCYHGYVHLVVGGQGSVKLNSGFVYPQTRRCSSGCRIARVYRTRGPRVALTETPSTGWKFAGWGGYCKSMKRTCAINLSRVTAKYGDHFTKVIARFTR